VCVVDKAEKVVVDCEVAHDAEGLASLRKRLGQLSPAAELPVAIERPSGLVVDTLVAAGHPVVPVHPNVVEACRPRYRAVGAKHDAGDAYLLADVLRTDGPRFRPLTPQSEAIQALRAPVRTRDDLVAERVALANQRRSLLERFWPGAAALFSDIDSPIARAFVRRYPTPQSAAHRGDKRLASFLAQEQSSGRKPVAALRARLRAAPASVASEAEAKGELVKTLARLRETLVAALAKLSSRIEHAAAALVEGPLILSLPRGGRINAAQILAELGDVRERFHAEEQLAAEAGVRPVTYESGKSRGVGFRWACNHRLRRAITTWADDSRHASPWAAEIYARARARGCAPPRAIRILARAGVRVLWRI
jgi:transposase